MTGRPTFNKDYVLTQRQKNVLFAMIITDGWLSQGKKNKTPLVGFENCEKNKQLVFYLFEILKDLIRKEAPTLKEKLNPTKTKTLVSWTFRTVNHPQFFQFVEMFAFQGKYKTIPTVSNLMKHLDWESLAIMIMSDGSRKGGGRGMELHLQGFNSKKALDRLCVAIYHRFGIKCFPSYYSKSKNKKHIQYHIQISGYSLPVIIDKVSPKMLEDFQYKIPKLGKRKTIDCYNSPWWKWYRETKTVEWLETLDT